MAGGTFQALGARSMSWPLRAAQSEAKWVSWCPHLTTRVWGQTPNPSQVEPIVSSVAPFHLPHKAPDKLAQLTVFNEARAPGWSQRGITVSE